MQYLLICCVLASACGTEVNSGSDASAHGCSPYALPEGTDLNTPTISFKTQVMKVFNNNCGLTTCHGTTNQPQGGLFLGTETAMGSDASQVFAGLVGKPAAEASGVALITASDWTKSYLMQKIDNVQCVYESQCADGNCMALMPSGGTQVMPVGTRDIVRRWIAQGAQLN